MLSLVEDLVCVLPTGMVKRRKVTSGPQKEKYMKLRTLLHWLVPAFILALCLAAAPARLLAQGIILHKVTLHVGAGTFLPVKSDDTAAHRMHAEEGSVTAETADALNRARRAGGRIVAIGSTSLRLLESASGEDGVIRPFAGETALFITPGYRFRAVDVMLSNFHLPRSTLFMLVSTFAGLDRMRAAYAHAIAGHYRFFSYGDACLLDRALAP
jgi:S-adenosylmethionine:tRNA ribosyltransferase-isomerase